MNNSIHEHDDLNIEGYSHDHEPGHIHTHGGHPHVHPNKKSISNRLARAIGHLEKVKAMVDDDVDCSEVLTQLSAVKSAINNVGKIILLEHLNQCIVDAIEQEDFEAIEEFGKAIQQFVK